MKSKVLNIGKFFIGIDKGELDENFHGENSAPLSSCVRVYPVKLQARFYFAFVVYFYAADASCKSYWFKIGYR